MGYKKIFTLLIKYVPAPVVGAVARALSSVPAGRRFALSIAVRGRVPVKEIRLSDRLSIVADGSQIANIAYFFGADAFEPGEIAIWENLCKQSFNIVEIGGNIGLYTVFGAAAVTSGRYRVFEPHPTNVRSLRLNVELNELDVEVFQAAVVGRNGPDSIMPHIPQQETGGYSTGAYIDGAEGINRPGSETFKVITVLGSSLDDGVDLLKLDVEGAEFEILDSMGDSIAKSRPVVLCEVRRPDRTPQLDPAILR